MQSQKAVSAYFTSKQILPYGFAEHTLSGVCFQQTRYIELLLVLTFGHRLRHLPNMEPIKFQRLVFDVFKWIIARAILALMILSN